MSLPNKQKNQKMKRLKLLSFDKGKNTSDLIKDMQTIQIEYQRNKLKKILTQRKEKLKEIMKKKQISHPKINYLRRNGCSFSFIESNASKQPFVPQKQKKRSGQLDRVYCSSPNMKVGVSDQVRIKEIDDRKIRNQKFLEFDRIIDMQSGFKKIEALKKLKEFRKYQNSKVKNIDLKKTFFQKLVVDKFNFYSANEYQSIRSSIMANDKVLKEANSPQIYLSKLKSATTLDSSLKQKEFSSLNNSVMQKSKISHKKINNVQKNKRQLSTRSRIKTHGSQIVPISFQKNLDCMNY